MPPITAHRTPKGLALDLDGDVLPHNGRHYAEARYVVVVVQNPDAGPHGLFLDACFTRLAPAAAHAERWIDVGSQATIIAVEDAA